MAGSPAAPRSTAGASTAPDSMAGRSGVGASKVGASRVSVSSVGPCAAGAASSTASGASASWTTAASRAKRSACIRSISWVRWATSPWSAFMRFCARSKRPSKSLIRLSLALTAVCNCSIRSSRTVLRQRRKYQISNNHSSPRPTMNPTMPATSKLSPFAMPFPLSVLRRRGGRDLCGDIQFSKVTCREGLIAIHYKADSDGRQSIPRVLEAPAAPSDS